MTARREVPRSRDRAGRQSRLRAGGRDLWGTVDSSPLADATRWRSGISRAVRAPCRVTRESPASDANRAIVNVAWTSPLPISRDMAASMDEAAAALIGLVILVVLRGAAR